MPKLWQIGSILLFSNHFLLPIKLAQGMQWRPGVDRRFRCGGAGPGIEEDT